MKKRRLFPYQYDKAIYCNAVEQPPGFLVSDNGGTQWVSMDTMDVFSPFAHAQALKWQTVGFEYGE